VNLHNRTPSSSYSDGRFVLPSEPRPSVSSRLDPRETNVDSGQEPRRDVHAERHHLEQSFRHSFWQHHRLRIAHAMPDAGLNPARCERFVACGSAAWVVQHPDFPDRFAVRSAHCRDRFCVPCAREKAFRVAQNVLKHVHHRQLRFITLTLRHSELPLSQQLDHLLSSFRKLRASPTWKTATTGGAAFLELKLGVDGRHWHPHLHILHEGQFIPHSHLVEDWHRITKTSYIVDIRSVQSRRDVVHYVTKYSAKPIGSSLTSNPDRLTEALTQLTARRLMTTFGSWRGLRLCAQPEHVDWQPIAPLTQLIARHRVGDDYATRILSLLPGALPWIAKHYDPPDSRHPPPVSP